ncbi:MAG: hypothetical protein PHQ23_14435, partial [Candidatus Wallbacteria bacterium]|nr:hypothetical protein [Candidatus Wallbacteria bacterium]
MKRAAYIAAGGNSDGAGHLSRVKSLINEGFDGPVFVHSEEALNLAATLGLGATLVPDSASALANIRNAGISNLVLDCHGLSHEVLLPFSKCLRTASFDDTGSGAN